MRCFVRRRTRRFGLHKNRMRWLQRHQDTADVRWEDSDTSTRRIVSANPGASHGKLAKSNPKLRITASGKLLIMRKSRVTSKSDLGQPNGGSNPSLSATSAETLRQKGGRLASLNGSK